MSKPYDDNMKGVLYKNDRKTSDKAPDFRGHCEIHHVKYWLAGWKKQAKETGNPYISLAVSPMDEEDHGF